MTQHEFSGSPGPHERFAIHSSNLFFPCLRGRSKDHQGGCYHHRRCTDQRHGASVAWLLRSRIRPGTSKIDLGMNQSHQTWGVEPSWNDGCGLLICHICRGKLTSTNPSHFWCENQAQSFDPWPLALFAWASTGHWMPPEWPEPYQSIQSLLIFWFVNFMETSRIIYE